MAVTDKREQWQLHGSAPEIYQRYLVPAVFAPWVPVLIEHAALEAGERVLDVACGTGVVARSAARHVGPRGRVVGLDLNPAMLAIARSLLPDPTAAAIEWCEGKAEAIPLAAGSFTVGFCQQGLQYFLDRQAALREMSRVLVPSGRAILSVWRSLDHSPGYAALAEALERWIGPETRQAMLAPFALGGAGELRSMLVEAGFQDVEVRSAVGAVRFASPEEFVVRRLAGSPLAGVTTAAGAAVLAAIVADIGARLRAFVGAEGLTFPIGTNLAIGRVSGMR